VDDEIDISLREFGPSVAEAYRTLFPGDCEKSPDPLNWRFQSNPHGRARFAVAGCGDRIVGMIALVPTQLTEIGGIGYQAIDTAVHPSVRGQGLFVKLGKMAQDPAALGATVLWGFPNENAAPGWFGRLGWTNFGAVPLLIRPLRSGFLFGRVHSRLRHIDLPLVRNARPAANISTNAMQLIEDFGGLWQSVVQDFGIAVDRNPAWMRWRLLDKPAADYRCAGLRSDSGDLEAFVATKVANKHGGRLCYVMEAISTPDRSLDLAKLLRGELALAAQDGAEAALAWCPRHAPNYSAYRKAGFLPFPSRLRPIEINFGARALRSEGSPAAAKDAPWYVSFLDSDTN
jgi:hypothetical protein